MRDHGGGAGGGSMNGGAASGGSGGDVEAAVRRARPAALGDEHAAAARELARAAAGVSRERRPRIRGVRGMLGGTVLGLGLLGLGVTAAVAGPAVIDWAGWTPDAVAERTFALPGDGSLAECEVVARVVPEYGVLPRAEADARTREARIFLTEHDWSSLVAGITPEEIEAEYALEAQRRAGDDVDFSANGGIESVVPASGTGGTAGDAAASDDVRNLSAPPPASRGAVASSLMGDAVSAAFEDAGFLDGGVGLEMAGHCASAGDTPTDGGDR